MKRTSLFVRSVQEFERRYLRAELERHGWNRRRTALELGISYRTLLYKIERLGLTPPDSDALASA
jgi:DNA-binding NtrC family response regulator